MTSLIFFQEVPSPWIFDPRFSDYVDRLYITNSDFDPVKIFSDDVLNFTSVNGLLHVLDKSMNGRMAYYMTQSHTIRLFWRTVAPFHSPAADRSAVGFRFLAYPATGM